MAYAERRERSNGPRYRGIYRDADGRYKSYGTEERALEVAKAAEKYAAELTGLHMQVRSGLPLGSA